MGNIQAPKSENEIRFQIAGHEERNAVVLQRFECERAPLDEPHSINFHFWAWRQQDAALLAKSLYDAGHLVLVLAPAEISGDPERWNIETGMKATLRRALSRRLTEEIVRLAAKHQAVYDGWGVSL